MVTIFTILLTREELKKLISSTRTRVNIEWDNELRFVIRQEGEHGNRNNESKE
jgi:hypothetical protein